MGLGQGQNVQPNIMMSQTTTRFSDEPITASSPSMHFWLNYENSPCTSVETELEIFEMLQQILIQTQTILTQGILNHKLISKELYKSWFSMKSTHTKVNTIQMQCTRKAFGPTTCQAIICLDFKALHYQDVIVDDTVPGYPFHSSKSKANISTQSLNKLRQFWY